jgi:hypothetical protein
MGKPAYKKYVYVGPVEEFGRCVAHNWTATTYAPSERKARSNFIFQFNKANGKIQTTKINLPGRITLAEGKESA